MTIMNETVLVFRLYTWIVVSPGAVAHDSITLAYMSPLGDLALLHCCERPYLME